MTAHDQETEVLADHAAGADPAERGRLTLDERAVRRLAEQAAAEVTGRTGRGSGLDAITGQRLPAVRAKVIGRHVRLDVKAPASGDMPLPESAAAVRERVTDRVGELTGLTVDYADVHLEGPVRGAAPGSEDVLPPASPPRGSGPARRGGVLIATLVFVAGAVAVYDAIVGLGLVGGQSLSAALLEWIDGLEPATWMAPVGVVVALVGLWAILSALWRRPRRDLPVRSDTGVYASRSTVARLVIDTAMQHSSVLKANALVRPKVVVVRMRTDGEESVEQEVRDATHSRIGRLSGPPQVRTVARRAGGAR